MILNTIKLTVKSLRGVNMLYSMKLESFHGGPQRSYRYNQRRPSKVVNEDDIFEVMEDTSQETQPSKKISQKERLRKELIKDQNKTENETKIKNIKEKKVKAAKKYSSIIEELHTVPNSSTMYTKLYENDKNLGAVMVNLKSKKFREKNDKILLEGRRLIQDAIEAGAVLEMIIFSRIEELQHISIPENVKLYKVPYRTIQLWSNLTTPSGIMGIFKTPDIKRNTNDYVPLSIICDNVRDPGNLGSILRAAAGVGCDQILLSKGCVDVWEPKVLRSAAGAHFRMPIQMHQSWEDILSQISSSAMIYIADNNAAYNDSEELNEHLEEDVVNPEQDSVVDTNPSVHEKKIRKKMILRNLYSIPIVPYYSVNYTCSEVVLIIGGETKGISEEAFSLVRDRQGIRVNVPLNNNIESLNTGMAMGIIAFEVKRQFSEVKTKLENLKQ